MTWFYQILDSPWPTALETLKFLPRDLSPLICCNLEFVVFRGPESTRMCLFHFRGLEIQPYQWKKNPRAGHRCSLTRHAYWFLNTMS
jgi:hypothetical protein